MIKVLLCVPPAYAQSYPLLATPMLAGFLKSKDIDVVQRDFNADYYDYLAEKNLLYTLTSAFAKEKIDANNYYSHLIFGNDSYDYPHDKYIFENNISSSYRFTENMLSSSLLTKYIKDSQENLYYNFFLERAIPFIIENKIKLVGISITAPSQVISAFTLGNLIKSKGQDIHIVIGGPWVSLYKNQLKRRTDFINFFDMIIFLEGETPLYKLVRQLSQRKSLSKVPNLIYNSGSKFTENCDLSIENLDLLSTPDFDGLFLNKYESAKNKEICLTIESARGCYCDKCAFCVHVSMPRLKYRERKTELVLKDIENSVQKYGANHFIFCNLEISAKQMLEISKGIIKKGINITWDCLCRLDNIFNKKIFEVARQAGCEKIGFGLESINQRVLDVIQKGINRKTVIRVLNDAKDAGIKAYIHIMFGLPTETISEALDTLNFLSKYKKIYAAAILNVYHLTPGTEIYDNPEKFFIKYDKSLPFKFFHKFEHLVNGCITKKCGENLIKLCEKFEIPAFSVQR